MKNRNKISLPLLGFIIMIAGLFIILLSTTVLKHWLIIGFGVRTFALVRLVGVIVVVSGFLISIIQSIPLIKKWKLEKQQSEQEQERFEERSKVLADYTKNSTSPELTRKRLEQLRHSIPGIDDLIEHCFKQMDRMDELQAKQQLLIESNDALYLRETVAVLDNVERRLCRNFRNIINLCTVAEDANHIDMDEVKRNLRDNKKKLESSKELLAASAKRINQYNAGDERSSWDEVESWIQIIRDSLKEEEKEK